MPISAKELKKSLKRAVNIGIVEETVILNEVSFTFRNLRAEEVVAIQDENKDLEGAEYIIEVQKHHVARSIIKIDETDLRGQRYIEIEDDKGDSVLVETYRWLLDNIINTWGQQTLFTAYRKFIDVTELADRKTKEGVKFLVPDELDEQKYRRLIQEAQEVEGQLPATLIDSTLREFSLMKITKVDEDNQVSSVERAVESVFKPVAESASIPEPIMVKSESTKSESVIDPHEEFQKALRKAPEPQVTDVLTELDSEPKFTDVLPTKPIDPTQVVVDPPMAGVNPRFRQIRR